MDTPSVLKEDTKIPIPPVKTLAKMYENLSIEPKKKTNLGRPFKHEDAYEAFCEWYALPTELKKPGTAHKFENRWRLPRRYTEEFKKREDFKPKSSQAFFDWMMGLWPDIVYALYKAAVKGSAPQARIFADIILKKMDIEKPSLQISPMVIMGVPQEKIDKLFIPKEYEKVKEITPVT